MKRAVYWLAILFDRKRA